MLPITREWVQKAEGDYDVVSLLLRSRKPSRHDPICFHAQQCIEKYLKARLVEGGISFPKTHDLSALLAMTAPIEPLWNVFLPQLAAMTNWAVLPRYPGMHATNADARDAVSTCRSVREVARRAPGLRA